MPVADLADRLQVPVGRRDDPVRPDDRLEDDRGDRLRPLVLEDLLEVRRARADRAWVRMAGRAPVGVRVEHPDDAGHARLDGPAAGIAGQRHGAVRRSVVGAVPGDDLVPAGVEAGELDGVLVRLRAAVREERDGEVAGRDLREHAAEARARLVRHRRADRAELVGLVLDRLDDLRVLVADVDVDELRGEVQVALPVVIPEMTALGTGDRDRVDLALHRPRVEDVLLRVRDDLGTEVRVRLDDGHLHAPSLRSAPMVSPFAAGSIPWLVGVGESRQDPMMAIIESSSTDVLLEREEPLATLHAAFAGAAAGQGRLVFVGGEAGVGKTSLVRPLLRRAPGGNERSSGEGATRSRRRDRSGRSSRSPRARAGIDGSPRSVERAPQRRRRGPRARPARATPSS